MGRAKCCTKTRMQAKRAATRKAVRQAKAGVTPKKASPKKGSKKKAAAKKATPCRPCQKKAA